MIPYEDRIAELEKFCGKLTNKVEALTEEKDALMDKLAEMQMAMQQAREQYETILERLK
jgi:prefoldin subunit 5